MEHLPAGESERTTDDTESRDLGIIYSARGEEPLQIEPTDRPGVYNVPNGVLTTTYVNIAEVDAANGGRPTPPIDWC